MGELDPSSAGPFAFLLLSGVATWPYCGWGRNPETPTTPWNDSIPLYIHGFISWCEMALATIHSSLQAFYLSKNLRAQDQHWPRKCLDNCTCANAHRCCFPQKIPGKPFWWVTSYLSFAFFLKGGKPLATYTGQPWKTLGFPGFPSHFTRGIYPF